MNDDRGIRGWAGAIHRIVHLAMVLAVARFKLRITGRYLGILWYILEPLAFMLILLALQVDIGGASIPRYPAYLLLGLIMTNFFIGSVSGAVKSIRDNKNIIQSISIDAEVLPLSTVLQFVFSHVFELLLFIGALLYFHIFSWNILWYLPIFACFVLFTFGISFICATVGVFIEDFDNIWNVGSRLLWFATPIFYSVASTGIMSDIIHLNPLYYFITIARDSLIYATVPSALNIFIAINISVMTFVVGGLLFVSWKNRFAEYI